MKEKEKERDNDNNGLDRKQFFKNDLKELKKLAVEIKSLARVIRTAKKRGKRLLRLLMGIPHESQRQPRESSLDQQDEGREGSR